MALLSIVLNIDRIYQQNQVSFVEKGFSQLIAYGVFFFVVIATVRPEEMPAFSRLILALTFLTALGTFYESRTGYNVFYAWSAKLLQPGRDRRPSADRHPSEVRGEDRCRAYPARARPRQHADDRPSFRRVATA